MGTRCPGDPGDRQIPLDLPPPSQPNPSHQPKKIVSALLSVGNVYQHTVPNNLLCVAMRGSHVALRRPLADLRGPFVNMRGPFADMGRLFGLRRPCVGLGDSCVRLRGSCAGLRSLLSALGPICLKLTL